jgi:hypothetical protein
MNIKPAVARFADTSQTLIGVILVIDLWACAAPA